METNPAVSLLLALAIIVGASRLGGGLARHFKQPRVVGELLVGVLLGPTLLNFLHWDIFRGAPLETTIGELAELGVVLLMFIIGLEVNLRELIEVGRVGVFAGFLGALVPIALTLPLAVAFDYQWQPALFAGVTLAATSVSISAQVLFELSVLQSKEGNALLATALIDDILAILLVSLTVAVVTASAREADAGSQIGPLLLITGRIAAYVIGAALLAWFVVPRFMNWIAQHPSVSQSYGIPALALIILLVFAWSAEALGGVATITGSFLAGIGLSRTREHIKHSINESVNYLAYVLLVPIFLIDIGLSVDLSTFSLNALPFASLLLLSAVVSKIGGCGLGALLGGFTRIEALRLGVCMISRGEVGLIVASLGLSTGVFQRDSALFSSLFLVIMLSTLITPVAVRQVFMTGAARAGV